MARLFYMSLEGVGDWDYALQAIGADWKIVPDNFGLTIRGDDITAHAFGELLDRLLDPEIWENDRLWRDVDETLPSYRLSKFQPLMPPRLAAPVVPTVGPPIPRDGARPIRWIASDSELAELCESLRAEPRLGLDVVTTIPSHTLCLIQIASAEATYILDALDIADLSPLSEILGDPKIVKIIHNAPFGRRILDRYGVPIAGIVDTLRVSHKLRGRKIAGGHSLKSVCGRELGIEIDKSEQASDWTQRPLSDRQVAYAALDAEVLLRLYEHFGQSAIEAGENLSLWVN